MKREFNFAFGSFPSRVLIQDDFPALQEIAPEGCAALMVTDTNTEGIARKISGGREIPLLVLESGEKSKTWDSVEKIVRAGRAAGLGRDGLFIGVGGGVTGDLTAFAASIYMRGARLCLVSTTLLGMVDASLGGKTGIDLLGLKNLAGSFYPAGLVVMPLAALDTLPEREWKSGMAELIKTAVLDTDEFLELTKKLKPRAAFSKTEVLKKPQLANIEKETCDRECLKECISRAVAYKGRIVEADPRETGKERPLLNLGHTFGHALEGAIGLGAISHGEAVAWGMVRACELGLALGITSLRRAEEIRGILTRYGYETKAPHPLAKDTDSLVNAMKGDKKQVAGKIRFIVPGAKSAQIVSAMGTPALEASGGDDLIRRIIKGECPI